MGMNSAARLLEKCGNLTIMEVCGTHTASIARSGLHALLPANIRLVSGPGCPVCVTDAGFIDTVIEFSCKTGAVALSFGDLFRVRGSERSFAEAKAEGARFRVIYSPLEALELARKNPGEQYIVAAVGFETTAPLYALLIDSIIAENIRNIRLCAALKTIVPAMDFISRENAVSGFICPGHVGAVIGANAFNPLLRYGLPMAVAGFEPEEILAAICKIAVLAREKRAEIANLYSSVVSESGNEKALALIDKYFTPADGAWRGIGEIAGSALEPRREYAEYFIAAERASAPPPAGCRCSDVLLGRAMPRDCALFGKRCTPENPVGACMVSHEGACGIWYEHA